MNLQFQNPSNKPFLPSRGEEVLGDPELRIVLVTFLMHRTKRVLGLTVILLGSGLGRQTMDMVGWAKKGKVG